MVITYISDVGRKNLHTYKYLGSDNSYSYNYLLSPAAEFFVKFIPLSIAPNLITYLGHLSSLMLYILPLSYCSLSMTCKIPSSTIFLCSFFYFLWMLLDNIDGKQARRTKNSTPLGLIFDHQVDALAVTITTIFIGIVTLFGNSIHSIVLWVMGALPFYLATWEELFVGVQNFPGVNGPSDGCLMVGTLFLVFGVWTPEYFEDNGVMGVSYMSAIYAFFFVGSLGIAFYRYGIFSVVVVAKKSKRTGEAILALRGFLMFVVAIVVINKFSVENLIVSATRELMIFFGFCFAREILYIQLAHVTDTEYRPLWLMNGIILLVPCLVMVGNRFLGLGVDEYSVVVGLVAVAGLSYCHMAYSAANEIAEELQINIFRINKVKGN